LGQDPRALRLGLRPLGSARLRCAPQLEPLRTVAESMRPVAIMAIVIRRRRSGVSHAQRFVASQLRAPPTVAPALIAPIMHCMHTRARV